MIYRTDGAIEWQAYLANLALCVLIARESYRNDARSIETRQGLPTSLGDLAHDNRKRPDRV